LIIEQEKGRAASTPNRNNPPTAKEVLATMLPEAGPEHTVMVLYDLRDPVAQEEAHADRDRWGREYVDVHAVGLDHVVLVFRPGGAAEAAA